MRSHQVKDWRFAGKSGCVPCIVAKPVSRSRCIAPAVHCGRFARSEFDVTCPAVSASPFSALIAFKTPRPTLSRPYFTFLLLDTDDPAATLKALEISAYESSMMANGMKTQMAVQWA